MSGRNFEDTEPLVVNLPNSSFSIRNRRGSFDDEDINNDPNNDDPPPKYTLFSPAPNASFHSYIDDNDHFEHEEPPTYDQVDHGQNDLLVLLEQSAHQESDVGPMFRTYEFNPGGTNTVYTIFLIVNAALGAGLLNFPKAFDEAGGVVVAITVQGILMLFILGALVILAYCADQNLAETIQEAMEVTAGKWGNRITSICVILYTLGTTITFLIIIGDQFDRALASLYGHTFCYHWYMNRNFTMTVSSLLIVLPMCYSQKIDFLRMPGALGVIAIFYIVGLIAFEYFYGNFIPGKIKTKPTTFTDVFLVVPDICFGYQCHVSVIPIYSCMRHRKIKHFTFASFVAVGICALCYTVAATFGYLTFGSLVQEDILVSYSAKRPEVLVAIIAMALKTYTTYPILLFCGREGIRSLLSELHCFRGIASNGTSYSLLAEGRGEKISRIVIVTMWFSLSIVLAIVIPNIGDVIKVLGSLAAIFIFVLPGLGLLQYANRSDPSGYLWKTRFFILASFVFLAIGAFIFGVVLTQAIQSNLNPDKIPDTPICYH